MTKKSNLELATKIVTELGDVKKHEEPPHTWYADLYSSLGMQLGSMEEDQGDAIKDMSKQLAGAFDREEIHLSDTWAEDNLSKAA